MNLFLFLIRSFNIETWKFSLSSSFTFPHQIQSQAPKEYKSSYMEHPQGKLSLYMSILLWVLCTKKLRSAILELNSMTSATMQWTQIIRIKNETFLTYFTLLSAMLWEYKKSWIISFIVILVEITCLYISPWRDSNKN